MITIVSSTALVQASGIEAGTIQIQGGQPSTSTNLSQIDGPFNETNLLAGDDVAISGGVVAFGGASQDGFIINADSASSTATTTIEVFFPDFSRAATLFATVGTTGTVEKFFDRSPFFFTPSEVDPNTLRDLSEVQQFLVFTTTQILSYNDVISTAGNTKLISTKGDKFKDGTAATPDLRKTSNLNSILTIHPTAEGFPFTISGSDDINQVDQTGPFFDETSPASGTSFNDPFDTTVEFHIKDAGSPLNEGSIEVRIDSLLVITAGATVTGTTWPTASKTVLAPGNIQYIFNRGTTFDSGATVTVSGQFEDLAAVSNQTIDSYEFTVQGFNDLGGTISGSADADPPIITPTNPVDLDTNISPDTKLLWNLSDNAAGVDPTSVKLFINGGLVLSNDVASAGSFTRTGTPTDGFTYTYTPATSFAFGSTVTGTIEASDLATIPNDTSLTYEFTITATDSLSIDNFFLDVNESTLLTSGTDLCVEVNDSVFGIATADTFLTINGTTPSGLITTTTGIGPSFLKFTVPLEPLVNFREDLNVFVHAENNFPGAFPVIEESLFILRAGYGVDWPNTGVAGPEETFSYVTTVDVLLDVKNFAKNFAAGSSFFNLLTENQAKSDLGAIIESNIKIADLSAVTESINPFFEYGKTIVLEIEVDDLEGNQLRFTHTFEIEPRP